MPEAYNVRFFFIYLLRTSNDDVALAKKKENLII